MTEINDAQVTPFNIFSYSPGHHSDSDFAHHSKTWLRGILEIYTGPMEEEK